MLQPCVAIQPTHPLPWISGAGPPSPHLVYLCSETPDTCPGHPCSGRAPRKRSLTGEQGPAFQATNQSLREPPVCFELKNKDDLKQKRSFMRRCLVLPPRAVVLSPQGDSWLCLGTLGHSLRGCSGIAGGRGAARDPAPTSMAPRQRGTALGDSEWWVWGEQLHYLGLAGDHGLGVACGASA